MVIRFFKEVEIEEIKTIVNDDGELEIIKGVFKSKIGKVHTFIDMVPTSDDKRFVDIIMPSEKNESRILKNADTLTFSILGGMPEALIDKSESNQPQEQRKSCCP